MHWTIHSASAALRSGTLSPGDLLDLCLERVDRYERRIRAWVFIDQASARTQAETAATELRQGQWRGPLHGVPIGIKDIMDVYDWPTAAGSRLWTQSVARHDATVVRRLRQAGAVLLGKTVTTQYASFDPPPTRNPWNVQCTPAGSSSGAAAAVACGMCLGALGSQTGGSVTRPAAFCGVCGLKPSWGRVSVEGVLPLAPSLDHVGVIARRVRDLAILLQPIVGYDEGATRPYAMPDMLRFKLPHREPIRIGRLHGPFDELTDSECRDRMSEFAKNLVPAGRTEVKTEFSDIALPAGFSEVWPHHRSLMAAEAAHYH